MHIRYRATQNPWMWIYNKFLLWPIQMRLKSNKRWNSLIQMRFAKINACWLWKINWFYKTFLVYSFCLLNMVGTYENLKIHRYITAQFIIKLDGALYDHIPCWPRNMLCIVNKAGNKIIDTVPDKRCHAIVRKTRSSERLHSRIQQQRVTVKKLPLQNPKYLLIQTLWLRSVVAKTSCFIENPLPSVSVSRTVSYWVILISTNNKRK